ncbi:3-demethylubiquinone-9 3-methyltransferase protein [Streptomyces bingchenggensis BCW-1]|uniref:3-demethylubiquinone-9 3-methyltransferase protein n=1 Tax=Streptomyces bingchenggensis (strain BCW-1) TaxID=749414 RepID=D7CB12_STRBB|nr:MULTISPECIES: class I SAM-dependent methyltransferase [Streptomyces]ADI10695.1 3-demethylubiquinone-9 3-methyltransferase protein [Streptomyces bingchenggensis BCW-1]
MVAGWKWDDTLFSGTAAYYRRGRLPYAPGLADALADALQLDGRGRLIDVGCGPGILALSLAQLFHEVVGLDPDSGMIDEAGREAALAGVADRTRWVRARAEELPAGLGTFTVATFGQSFHWMDRDLVAATIKGMLRPGGALVHISDLKNEPRTIDGLPHPPVPYAAMDELVRRYLGPVRRAGQGLLPQGTPGGEAAVFARAGFSGPQRHVVAGGQALVRTWDDAVAGVFSMSYSAPHLFGSRRDDFEADLRRLLREASPPGRFSERQPSTEVFVWWRDPTEL